MYYIVIDTHTTVECCAGNPRPSQVQAPLTLIWDQKSQVAQWAAAAVWRHLDLRLQTVEPALVLPEPVGGSTEDEAVTQTKRLCEDSVNT